MTNNTITNQSYDTFASEYRKLWGQRWRQTEGELFKKFINLLSPKAKLLDAGCGTGDLLQDLLQKGFDAYGIDESEGMLKEARSLVEAARLAQMDICDLAYPDNTFDGVISLYVLQHINNVGDAIKELKRVTQNNGYIYLGIHIGEYKKGWKAWYSFPKNGGKVYMNYRSVEEIMKLLRQNKLKIIDQTITRNEKATQNLHIILKKPDEKR